MTHYTTLEQLLQNLITRDDQRNWWDGSRQLLFYKKFAKWFWCTTVRFEENHDKAQFTKTTGNLQMGGFKNASQAFEYTKNIFGQNNSWGFDFSQKHSTHAGSYQIKNTSTYLIRPLGETHWKLVWNNGLPQQKSGFKTRKAALQYRLKVDEIKTGE